MRWRLRAAALSITLLAGCGYFNTMYNAERRFRDAERARGQGEATLARAAYLEAIEKAAKSYRAHPAGRWADDALFLIGRARFQLAEYKAARGAMARLLDQTSDQTLRAGAHGVIGASSIALGESAPGAASLDSAFALGGAERLDPFLRLWRARAAFGLGDTARGWAELERATAGKNVTEARFEAANRAIALSDSTRVRSALGALFEDANTALFADSVAALSHAVAQRWGHDFAYVALEPTTHVGWPADARHRLALTRATHAMDAGDTATAIADATRIGELATGPVAGRARVTAATWHLSRINDQAELSVVRALLLPAIAYEPARELLGVVRTLESLLEFASERGQPLALFAAGELARDALHAPALARQLFLAYVDVAGDAIWAGKALLAALPLTSSQAAADSLRRRLERRPDDVYFRAISGDTDMQAYTDAEERLARGLSALHFDAAREAADRDPGVSLAAARLDSMRALAQADTLELRCGLLLDSLALRGTRADSVRSACIRGDSAHVGVLLTMDTLLWVTPRTLADSIRLRGGTGLRLDTILQPLP